MKIEIRGLNEYVVAMHTISEQAIKQIRQAAKVSLRDIQELARENHKFISRTGNTERSIDTRLDVTSTGFSGAVFSENPIAVYQHEGTKAHYIQAVRKKALRWVTPNGNIAFSRRPVLNPGIKPDPYLANAGKTLEPSIVQRFDSIIGGMVSR